MTAVVRSVAYRSLERGTPQVVTDPPEGLGRRSGGAVRVRDMGRQERAMNASSRSHGLSFQATCAECRRQSDPRWLGWRAYRTDDPELNEPPALAFYCHACAEREFGVRSFRR